MTYFYITGSVRDAIEAVNVERYMVDYPKLSADQQLSIEESARKLLIAKTPSKIGFRLINLLSILYRLKSTLSIWLILRI